jgi:hypothetical protein
MLEQFVFQSSFNRLKILQTPLNFGAPTFIYSVQASKQDKMGKGPAWTDKERELVTLAWVRATNNGIQGADQKSEVYRNKIHAFFKALAPAKYPAGCYGDRAPKAVHVFLRDKVFPDVNKFPESLRLVQASRPSGCNHDNILSMAIAVHLGETKRMDYQFKDYPHSKWVNFIPWKILSACPKFRPPTQVSEEMNIDPSDLTTVDPTAPSVPAMVAIPPTNNSVPETPAASTTLTEPTFFLAPPAPNSTDLLIKQSAELRQKVAQEMSALGIIVPSSSSSVAITTPVVNLDPSKGGRGAAMGQKKAKAQYQRQYIDIERNNHLKAIENSLKKQAKENVEAQQIFKMRQMIKLAKSLRNKRLMEKAEREAEKEIERMLNSKKTADDADDNGTSENNDDGGTSNDGGTSSNNYDDADDNDSLPPSFLSL